MLRYTRRQSQGPPVGRVIVLILMTTLMLPSDVQGGPHRIRSAEQEGGEVLIAEFANGVHGATSRYEYSGRVTLTVSGIGQASGTQYTDAFYVLTDSDGRPVDPEYAGGWILSINGSLAEYMIPNREIPPYRSDHVYTFDIEAPGGNLTFGVYDFYTPDNTGSYIIQIHGTSLDEVPYFSQRDARWAEHPLRTTGECSPYCSKIGTCGCTLTSSAMLFNYYGADLKPPILSDCMDTRACPFSWSDGASCSQDRARWITGYRFSWTRLDQELNQNGRPVILGMYKRDNPQATHWVLVVSGQGSSPNGYVVHDPWPLDGANTSLAVLTRQNYVFNRLAVYDGKATAGSLSHKTGATEPVLASAVGSNESRYETPNQEADVKPSLRESSVVTGTVMVYRVEETAVIIQLTAASVAGDVTEMKVWTDSNPESEWRPFETLTWLPWQPGDLVYARFRDEADNTSDDYSDSIAPAYSPPPDTRDDINNTVHLPAVFNNLHCRTVPTLMYPPDGSALDTLVPAFALNWHEEPDVTLGALEVARDPEFAQFAYGSIYGRVQGVVQEQRVIWNFDPATTYYWRAWLMCGEVRGPYSETWSFTTGSGGTFLPAPDLIAPLDKSGTASKTVTFEWSPVHGAVEYMVWVNPLGKG